MVTNINVDSRKVIHTFLMMGQVLSWDSYNVLRGLIGPVS